jgi:hypothetical protein
MRVVCVLKTGGDYDAEYVARLQASVAANSSAPLSFLCLTDDHQVSSFCSTIPLKHGWPSWWSKIELFRPGLLPGPSLYLDLDTLILGNIDELVQVASRAPFTALRGFNHRLRDPRKHQNFASGIMAGHFEVMSRVYEEFIKDPLGNMATRRENWRHGDQGFIASVIDVDVIPRLQDLLPTNYIVGKRITANGKRIPYQSRVLAWSGQPRIRDLGPKLKKYWGAA